MIRMHMEQQGWQNREKRLSWYQSKVISGTKVPGAYHNTSGLSKWFTRCERYERAEYNLGNIPIMTRVNFR